VRVKRGSVQDDQFDVFDRFGHGGRHFVDARPGMKTLPRFENRPRRLRALGIEDRQADAARDHPDDLRIGWQEVVHLRPTHEREPLTDVWDPSPRQFVETTQDFPPFAIPWTHRHEQMPFSRRLPLEACLGLFLRGPVPGRTKTRLIPALGDEGAASLYRSFVEDTLILALRSRARHCRLWVDGDGPLSYVTAGTDATIRDRMFRSQWSERPQADGDLGNRLQQAFLDAAVDDLLPMLIIGTDGPDLPERNLATALRALEDGAEVVLGAAADGGVWCIGLAQPTPGFFDDLPWSMATTGDALRARVAALGLRNTEVPAWYDCDMPDDLDALRDRLRIDPTRAKMTWQWLTNAGMT